jgi:hypothetical protein
VDFSNELKALVYLSIVTDRTLIIPNVLGDDGLTGIDVYKSLIMWPGFRIAHVRQKKKISDSTVLQESEEDDHVRTDKRKNFFYDEKNRRQAIEREVDVNRRIDISSLVTIVEPAYYWRIKRDYATAVPRPKVLSFLKSATLPEIERYLLSPDIVDIPRIVLHMDKKNGRKGRGRKETAGKEFDFLSEHVHNVTLNRLAAWADDSVGSYKKFSYEFSEYITIPKLYFDAKRVKEKNLLRDVIIDDIRPCDRILRAMRGNRSCFDKCQ